MLFEQVSGALTGTQEYVLSAEDKAMLRKAPLRYEGGQVSMTIVNACLTEEAQRGVAAACGTSNGSVALGDILQYLDGFAVNVSGENENRGSVSNAITSRRYLPELALGAAQ